jgi:hypothetical protein
MPCLPQLPHLLLALQEPRLLSRIGGADCQCSDGFQYVQRAWDLPYHHNRRPATNRCSPGPSPRDRLKSAVPPSARSQT